MAVVGLAAAFVWLGLPVFYYSGGYLLSNVDGVYYFSSYMASRRFGTPFDLQTFAFGQGFGAFQHPTILHPFWWIFEFTRSVQIAYLATELTLFLAVMIFVRILSRSFALAIACGFLATAAFFLPEYFVDHFGTVMPQHVLQIALVYLALALIGFGTDDWRWLPAGFAILVYCTVMDSLYLAFIAPLVGIWVAALGLSLLAERRLRPVLTLAAAGIVATIVVYASGVADAYDSFVSMALRAWSADDSPVELLPSVLVFGGTTSRPLAPWLGYSAIAAMIYFAVYRRRLMFFLSILVLAAAAALIAADWDSTGTNTYWTMPAIGYFERPLIPLYIVLVVLALRDVVVRLHRRFLRRTGPLGEVACEMAPMRVAAAVLIACVIAGISIAGWLIATEPDVRALVYRRPYYWQRVIEFLEALPFRRTAFPLFQPYLADLTPLLLEDCSHLRDPGNFGRDHQYCAFLTNVFSVPSFAERQNLRDLQTVQIYAQPAAFAYPHGEPPGERSRAALAPVKSLGIRYAAIRGESADAIASRDIDGKQVSLIDFGPIEAADLSIRALRLDRTYRRQDMSAARREQVAVIYEQVPYVGVPLSPVTDFDLAYGPGTVSVHAESAGESVVLLPFQFSHCLRVRSVSAAPADLIRVDGAQAALHFVKQTDVVISNRFRLFGDATCRKRDFADVFRLGLWPVQDIETLAAGRRVPFLMRKYLEARLRERDRVLAAGKAP